MTRGVTIEDRVTHLPVSFDVWAKNYTFSRRTPILENIYDAIASEFSKIELILSKDAVKAKPDGTAEHAYDKLTDNPNYNILALRPNLMQTKTEFLYTVAYQLHMYRNALVRITRDTDAGRNVVLALEPINCDDYLFGQGYEINKTLYLKLKEKKSGKILLLDYMDVIHLRLNPNDIFYGDKNDNYDLTSFIRIFDENISAMLNELKDAGSVHGIIEVGSGFGGGGGFNNTLLSNNDKVSKQNEIIDRIKATKEGIVVLDSGEKWHSLSKTFKTMSADEVNNMMKYLFNFKGINQAVIDGTATEAQMGVFFNKTIMPLVIRFTEELNYKFLTAAERAQGQRIEHFRNPFEYMSTKEMLSNLYLGAMFFTKNEVRSMALKLPPLPGGDDLMSNKNFTDGAWPKAPLKGGDDDDGTKSD